MFVPQVKETSNKKKIEATYGNLTHTKRTKDKSNLCGQKESPPPTHTYEVHP